MSTARQVTPSRPQRIRQLSISRNYGKLPQGCVRETGGQTAGTPSLLRPRRLCPRTKAPSPDELTDATLHQMQTAEAGTATQSCPALLLRDAHLFPHPAQPWPSRRRPHRHVELTHGHPRAEAERAHREVLLRLVVLVQVDPRPAVLLHRVAGEQLPGRKRGVFTHVAQALPVPQERLWGQEQPPGNHGEWGRKWGGPISKTLLECSLHAPLGSVMLWTDGGA